LRMADFVVPRHSAVMERLRRRIELFRRHHSSCENRYDNTAMERLELERQHTFALHQRCLHVKNVLPGRMGVDTQIPSEMGEEEPRRCGSVLRAVCVSGFARCFTCQLHETVKRKLENATSPLNGDQANGFGEGYSKKRCMENPLGVMPNGVPPVSPLHSLETKHSVGADKQLANGQDKNGGGLPESFRHKEFKQEPVDDDLPCMLPSGNSMSNNLFPDLNLNEQEWKELMEEFNRSVAYEDMQDIFNEGFEDRKDPELVPSTTQVSLQQDPVNIKAEFSPVSVAFEQEPQTGSPLVRPTSSGPPVHTTSPATTTRTASSPAMPTSQPSSQPQRQLPQNVMLPGPPSKDLSPAQQLQQLAAREQQRAQLMQNQQQHQQVQKQQQQQAAQKFHQPNHQPAWPQAASSQSPLGGTYGLDKPTSPSIYQQEFPNPKQLMGPNLPNKSSSKVAGGSYLPGGGHQNMLTHPPNSLSQNPVSSQSALLDYNNTKPLSHYEVDQGQRRTPHVQNKVAILSLLQQQRQQMPHLTEEQKRMLKQQKAGLPFQRPHVSHAQESSSGQAVSHVPGSVPSAGMGAQPAAPSMAGNHGNATYLSNQAAVMKQQQQQYVTTLFVFQEKQRQQQEQQLQRHLTRPPPQYQDQQNPFQQQQVNQFQGSSGVSNLGGPSNGSQQMFPPTPGMMPMGVRQAGGPSAAPPAAGQPEMGMSACSGLDSVQPVMYNNMGSGLNQMHPHTPQQNSVNNAQLQRQTVAMAQSGNLPGAYRQTLMASSGIATQQHHKGPANTALMKQQMARMPNAMGPSQSWQHQGMQGMNNQTPGGNGALGAFNNPGFHMQPRHPKMPAPQFAQAGLGSSRPMAAMTASVAGQMMPTLSQQRTNPPQPQQPHPQPPAPQQQTQPVVPGLSQPVPELTNFGQAQNPQVANRATLHCNQGYQVNRTANQELPFGYSSQTGSLPSFPGDSDLDTLLKSRTTQEWMDDLDELLATHH
ncbi:MAML1 protein, partial [Amia calva]|nr:MAML1 protein [Amia calva]